MSKSIYDVIVLGAGPAGGAVSLRLARLGYRVALIDKKSFPREKPCGCCYSAFTRSELSEIGIFPTAKQNAGLVLRTSDHSTQIPLEESFSLSRSKLDTAIVERASDAGVDFFPQHAYRRCTHRQHSVEVECRTERGKRRLIGQVLVNAMGLPARKAGDVVGLQATVHADVADHDLLEMNFRPWGYYGRVVLQTGELNIAAAVRLSELKAARAELEESNAEYGRGEWRWTGTPPLRYRGNGYSNQCFNIGDAAGYFEPLTGEGVGWALRSAREVVPYVARSLAEGWKRENGQLWRGHYRRVMAIRTLPCRLLSKLAHQPALPEIAVPLLERIPRLSRITLKRIHLRESNS